MFDGDYFWNPSLGDSPIEIRSVWKDLPEKPHHVDSVFQNENGHLWFFIGTSVYTFKNTTFLRKLSLQDFGIDEQKYHKIDAIFQWPCNKKNYIFSRDQYWLLEGSKVNKDYPKLILDTWHDVFDIDTVFSKDQKLFVLKDKNFSSLMTNACSSTEWLPQESVQSS